MPSFGPFSRTLFILTLHSSLCTLHSASKLGLRLRLRLKPNSACKVFKVDSSVLTFALQSHSGIAPLQLMQSSLQLTYSFQIMQRSSNKREALEGFGAPSKQKKPRFVTHPSSTVSCSQICRTEVPDSEAEESVSSDIETDTQQGVTLQSIRVSASTQTPVKHTMADTSTQVPESRMIDASTQFPEPARVEAGTQTEEGMGADTQAENWCIVC
jgi:hypothetical protein